MLLTDPPPGIMQSHHPLQKPIDCSDTCSSTYLHLSSTQY